MTTAKDQPFDHLFGLNALSPQDATACDRHTGTYSELTVVSNLLEQRRDTLNNIEYDGLLRVALRLRQEVDYRYTVPDHDEYSHWLNMIDHILDQAFITYPKPYANVGTYPSDSDDTEMETI